MLSGGEALENYALRNASSVLRALAKRMPAIAHRKRDSVIADVALDDIAVGDTLVVYPHDICPVDGTVIEGHGVMNEAFLTGEPFEITKAPGSSVISGAVNGASALTITASRRAVDSRYAIESRPVDRLPLCGLKQTGSVRCVRQSQASYPVLFHRVRYIVSPLKLVKVRGEDIT